MNLCADCQRPIGTCSWEKNFTPVPGWTATESKVLCFSPGGSNKYTHAKTYNITACPLFVPPPGYKPPKKPVIYKPGHSKPKRVVAVSIATGEETEYPSVRQASIQGGFIDSMIRGVLAGQYYSHYGYTFRYKEDDT